MKDMVTVGGSIGCAWIGVSTSGAQKVSATEPFSSPAIETMSPASPSSIGWRSRPRKARIFETRPFSTRRPSRSMTLMVWFGRTVPEAMRPVMMRPRNGFASRSVPSMRNGPSSVAGLRHVRQHEVEERREPLVLRPLGRGRHPAVAAGAVEDREVELLVGGVERGEEVEDLVDDLLRRARPAGRPC